jgi:hypothetical protein
MLFLLVYVLIVFVICVFLVWPETDRLPRRRRILRAPDAPARAGRPRPGRPESLEGVLVAKLMADEISRMQYLHSMEGLAARDDERHPLAVPPEIGPADA